MAEPRCSSRTARVVLPTLLTLASMMPAAAAPSPAMASGDGATAPAAVAADPPSAPVGATDLPAPPSAATAVSGPASSAPTLPSTAAPSEPATGQAAPVVPAVPAAVPPPAAPPPELAGDRADSIARDVTEHPPQKQVVRQDASHLRIAGLKLGGLLDRSVHGSENSEVGRVIDVMIGDDGKLAALELDVGGFMGVGNRKIAVAWSLFDVPKPTGTEPLRVALTEEQVRSAPAAEESGNVTVVTGADMPPAAAVKPTPPQPAPPSGTPNASPGTGASPPATPAPPVTSPAQPSTQAAPGAIPMPDVVSAPATVAPPPHAAPPPPDREPVSRPPGQPSGR